MIPRIALLSLPLVAPMLATPSFGQYVVGTTPPEASTTEQVDFGDIDLDGDWDVVVADGGDFGNDQNRIWVNLGGLQGGTLGEFEDQTAQRAPVISDASRDAEFADLDGDSDLDVWISNDAQITNQGDRIWINQGLAQGGTLGFFQDDTNGRFIGLGGTGSSVGAFLILPTGNFIDWSDDTDFGDLDNDGDLDVIHSSHAGAYGGQVPTRLFLNDGNGFFTEFNPSGFQLPFTNITNGDPGLWCEGTQQSETVNTTGLFCDVATCAPLKTIWRPIR